ncbi:MAG: hypothetical protein L6R37_005278 [Teloschistes peruensis]|nr:MAG: hypothetical protein L6R37_005278 [Teloschistes peruensis]
MAPSTRQSGQKRKANLVASAEPDMPDSSPAKSQTNKRRKAPATTTRRRPKTPEPEPDGNESGEETSSEAEEQTLADAVIPHLALAKFQVNAAVQHSNSRTEGANQKVQAYAKVCGRHWTYYVRDLAVIIGRPPDPVSRHESSPTPRRDAPNVQIDLGPSRAISRFHAELFYDMDDQQWHIHVKGRNPVQVNDKKLLGGEDSIIASGDILDVGGTQMIFVTAEGKANVHPMFLGQLDNHAPSDELTRPPPTYSQSHPATSNATTAGSSQRRPLTAPISSSQSNGNMAIPSLLPGPERPMTPTQSSQRQQRPSSAVRQSPTLARGFMIESTEHIDYSSDATKDIKPTISYSVMITQAILSSPDETKTLNDIYDWIKDHFAFYRHLATNWQNSIRHVLSLNPAFVKVPRGADEPGKGMKWVISSDKRQDMIQAVAKHAKRSYTRQSLPNSPATLRDDSAQVLFAPSGPAVHQSSETNGGLQGSSSARSPPLTAYPTARESYTPSRGPRLTTLANYEVSDNLPALSDDPSPLPIRRKNLKVGANDSSPVFPSSYFDGSIMTPAPRQHNLPGPLPNTIKMPTSHMPDSSPAPFWKYGEGLPGSTPARGWPDISPLKSRQGLGLGLQSSSPPPPALNGHESPTRGKGAKTAAMDVNVASAVAEADDEDGGFDLKR